MNTPAAEFLQLAERQIVTPRKARMRTAEKRAMRKALNERNAQMKLWRQWRQERIAQLLAGPHSADAQALVRFLDDLSSAAELIEFVKRGPWRQTDADTRFLIASLIDIAIIEVREKRGLPPFDDAMPFGDEPLTAFEQIREILG